MAGIAILLAHRKRGGHVVGICGGFQMLGRMVRDPDGIEGSVTEAEGLGLLDIETVMEPEKTVRNVSARSVPFGLPLEGYEIHLGRTTGPDTARPSAVINGIDDGAISADGKVSGTYLHGLFSADAFRANSWKASASRAAASTIAPRWKGRWTRSQPSWRPTSTATRFSGWRGRACWRTITWRLAKNAHRFVIHGRSKERSDAAQTRGSMPRRLCDATVQTGSGEHDLHSEPLRPLATVTAWILGFPRRRFAPAPP